MPQATCNERKCLAFVVESKSCISCTRNSSYDNQLHVLITNIFTYLSASPGLVGMVEQNRSKVLECSDFGMQLK